MALWSDSLLENNIPLLGLTEAGKRRNEKEVKEAAQVFWEHAKKLTGHQLGLLHIKQ